MKTVLTIAAAVAITLLLQNTLIPTEPTQKTESTAYERVIKTNTLRCAYALYPPFISKDPNTGKLTGIAVDLMGDVEKATGIQIVWEPEIDFGAVTETLQTGKADAFCTGMAMTPARGKVLAGSIPFTYGPIQAYVRADDHRFDNNPSAINTPDVKIEVNSGDLSEQVAKRFFPKATLVYKGTMGGEDQLFLDVALKKADITLSGPSNLSLYNKNNQSMTLRQIPFDQPVYSIPGVIAVDINETALMNMINTALQDLIDNGVVAAILKHHTSTDYGQLMSPPSHGFNPLPVRVYYEDTDAGGVVYYANYLKYAERARSEWVRAVTGREGPLWTDKDPIFVVRHLEVDYKSPARLDDSLIVTTKLVSIGGASLLMHQDIKRDNNVLVALKVTLVAITHNGKVLRLPPEWRQKLESKISST
ncbi:MAG: tol-pal system-associated acyl-CoA thioesterase [Alphaproteobacteria bacterium]|nr:tol-pal system-associated acyl-CoA thioesterase [Alphaproteobacteria bacterium]